MVRRIWCLLALFHLSRCSPTEFYGFFCILEKSARFVFSLVLAAVFPQRNWPNMVFHSTAPPTTTTTRTTAECSSNSNIFFIGKCTFIGHSLPSTLSHCSSHVLLPSFGFLFLCVLLCVCVCVSGRVFYYCPSMFVPNLNSFRFTFFGSHNRMQCLNSPYTLAFSIPLAILLCAVCRTKIHTLHMK